jgi:hypothetical protein
MGAVPKVCVLRISTATDGIMGKQRPSTGLRPPEVFRRGVRRRNRERAERWFLNDRRHRRATCWIVRIFRDSSEDLHLGTP